MADPHVVLAGDSIMAMSYLGERDRLLQRVANRLCGVHCGETGYASVRSVAHGGQRLTGGAPTSLLVEWPSILASSPTPTTIIVGIGINDAGLTTDAAFTSAYLQIMHQAEDAGIRVIPALMMAVNKHLNSYNEVYGPRYWWNRWMLTTFGESNVARFDLATKLPWNEDLDPAYEHEGDGLHPNRLGGVSNADSIPLKTRVV